MKTTKDNIGDLDFEVMRELEIEEEREGYQANYCLTCGDEIPEGKSFCSEGCCLEYYRPLEQMYEEKENELGD